jgi:kynurenine formamidase
VIDKQKTQINPVIQTSSNIFKHQHPYTIIDISDELGEEAIMPINPKVKYTDHKEGANLLAKASLVSKHKWVTWFKFLLYDWGILRPFSYKNFPDQMGLSWEDIETNSHAGTHLDSPWHFGPTTDGQPAKYIEQVPLEWCFHDGVVLDLRHKKPGEKITVTDLEQCLKKINYQIKPFDIVLLMTGADKKRFDKGYLAAHPGMTAESTEWLVDQGVKIIGTDGWGFDCPFVVMKKEYEQSGHDPCTLWPAHFLGRKKEYCHIESLINLDQIPTPFGFKVSCLPVKLTRGSAGWVRAVALYTNPYYQKDGYED